MSFISDAQRIKAAAEELRKLLIAYGSDISAGDLIDTYAAKFSELLSNSSGSAEYYECTGVDTDSKTWTGLKFNYTVYGYEAEDIPTTGLTYTGFTPQVGEIYDSEALVKVTELYNTAAEIISRYMVSAEASAGSAKTDAEAVARDLTDAEAYSSGLADIIG